MKKTLALILAAILVLSAAPLSALADTVVDRDGPTIRLNCYSQLANYSGIQTGWGAVMLKDMFNVELNIIPEQGNVYATRMITGDLGDIVVWGSNGDDYKNAVTQGALLDWEEDDLCATYAPYIWENYQAALESNRSIGGDDAIHGIGFNVAFTSGSHQSFFYTWDIRWDLYKQLGYPEVKDLDGLLQLFKDMKAICPTDEKGNPTYALSSWPDWDGNMVMYVKALATAYYGYDELGFGHYNPENGEFLDCLSEGSPYMTCLKFFNDLYRADLLDPASMTQTYDKMSEKVKNSGTFWSIFNYAGSQAYNSDAHLSEGKYMYAMVPTEARPIVYGLGNVGGSRIWSVGAYSSYAELCLEILNWFATPEGSMTMWYGPKGLTWDYDEQGGMYFTELGKKTSTDSKYDMTGIEWTSPYTGKTYTLSGTYNDGCIQINNTTLSQDMINPDGNGKETFNKDTWASNLTATSYPIQQDWRDHTGCISANDYMEAHPYLLMPDIPYSESARDSVLKLTWNQVKDVIVNYSWRAIYAKSDMEFNYHVNEMRKIANQYGWESCLEWCRQEAATKWALSQP